MKWTREQYLELMTFGQAERPMFSELFGPLIGLAEEWRAQGASDDEIGMAGFDWDYRACWDLVSSRGTRLFNQDSDGNMMPVLDAFVACGVNVTHPCEPAAGMDIVAVRRKYGDRLAILGGIDKHVLRGSREEIDRELEYKMQPLMRRGGTVFSLDHRIPNGTPLENYRYYVRRGREILGLPPLDGKVQGWGRMAF
jgi:hypothetical protein